ncbi:MAG: exodeoxyribonuclease III [Puniceicoccales bacterium]|jgi:exodeoxyribonuclease-3|nr:exodeoxyribonuclease III [Puniceicoccales bacterium]
MNVISWNVNGLRSILSKGLVGVIRQLNPDIICLQEIKVAANQIPEIILPGYAKIFNSADRPGYSGTAIFTKHEPLSRSTQAEIESITSRHEGRVILLEYDQFFLVNTYVPNSGAELARLPFRSQMWDVEFAAFTCGLAKVKPTIICGDFNVAHREIDLANPAQNHFSAGFTDEERRGFSNILAGGFIDTFRHQHPHGRGQYSWWSYRANARERNIGWRIDYVLVSKTLEPTICEAKIYGDVCGSDHAPVGAAIGVEF